MNGDEAKRVLAEVARLNRQPYGPEMVETWANALHDVAETDALEAVRGLARAGVERVTVANVNQWLRDQRAQVRRTDDARLSIQPACACTFTTICAEHQAIGLAAIAQIKAATASRKPVEPRKSWGRVVTARNDQGVS